MLAMDGLRGWFKNWATDMEMNVWQGEDTRTAAKRAQDEAKVREQLAKERARRDRSIAAARRFYSEAHPLAGLHPYLAAKGLSVLGCTALRQHDDLLVVPVLRRGAVVSVQTIPPSGEGKRYWPGAPIQGGSLVLQRQRASVTCVAEGLATGLAIFQSVGQARVIVAFDAGNLLSAAQAVGISGSAVICADNDHGTEARRGFNPGIQQAHKAAEALGCGVSYPTGIEGTDWADALIEWGARAPARVQREILAGARLIMSDREPVT